MPAEGRNADARDTDQPGHPQAVERLPTRTGSDTDSSMSETRNTSRSSIEISEEILRRIRNGQYLPGDALSQYELATEFETSRTPIREAFQIRAELEGLAAQLAVDWIDDHDLELLAQHQKHYADALRSRVRSESGSDWLKFNAKFHSLITQASHNERLHELVAELQGSIVSNVLGFASKIPPRLMEENIKQHEDIIAALTLRNGPAAREAMATHISRTTELVIEWMESRR